MDLCATSMLHMCDVCVVKIIAKTCMQKQKNVLNALTNVQPLNAPSELMGVITCTATPAANPSKKTHLIHVKIVESHVTTSTNVATIAIIQPNVKQTDVLTNADRNSPTVTCATNKAK